MQGPREQQYSPDPPGVAAAAVAAAAGSEGSNAPLPPAANAAAISLMCLSLQRIDACTNQRTQVLQEIHLVGAIVPCVLLSRALPAQSTSTPLPGAFASKQLMLGFDAPAEPSPDDNSAIATTARQTQASATDHCETSAVPCRLCCLTPGACCLLLSPLALSICMELLHLQRDAGVQPAHTENGWQALQREACTRALFVAIGSAQQGAAHTQQFAKA